MVKDEAYRKAEKRIEKARREGAVKLSLRNMKLTEVPEAIASLTQLQNLDLARNQLIELPEAITSLTQLQSLDLFENQLTQLPDAIASLTQLKSLELSYNQLTQLPDAIVSLTQLRILSLARNQLTILPETFCGLSQLRNLNLFSNQFNSIPSWINQLSSLEVLGIGNNYIRDLPDSIECCTSLQQLNLGDEAGGNPLVEIPAPIRGLKSLKSLLAYYCELELLPDWLNELTLLEYIDLRNNHLSDLPESLGKITGLKELNLRANPLQKVPICIRNLKLLETLGMENCELESLPEWINELPSLENLYLANNNLSNLPSSLGKLPLLEQLELEGNPLNPDLAAAYEEGTEAVLKYLQAKAEDEMTLYEAKLILIGEGEVGKSCLLGALRGDEWVDGRPTTHGIEIKPVIVTDPDSGTEITLNGWDFGGQRVYRPTHQLFFSAPAVYLVVWKPREGPQQGFVKEWITLIKNREPDAKVLVVATHGGPGQRQPDIDKQEILAQFGKETVIDFLHVDSKPQDNTTDCTGLAELKNVIARVAASLPEMGRSVPAKWQQVRETLQTSDKPYLPYKDVIAICAEHGVDEKQAELFLRISHTLGHFIHYHYDPTLRDIVILKPDWLAKAISFVLDDETTRKRNGLVEFEHLSELWSNPPFAGEEGYPKQLHPIFLRLMERFDLSYKVVLNPAEPSTTSLIAQLVPDQRPELPNWGEQPEPGDRQQVQICRIVDSRGQFAVAEGLFYQLIVRLHKYSLGRKNYADSIHWQRGLMLDNDYNGRALLEYVGTDVKITVRAAYPERFLSYLTEEIKWLVENFWEGLRCNVMVPCIATCGMNTPGHGLFEVQKLIDSKKKNRDDYPCPVSGCGEWQNIDQLLNNAPTSQPPSQAIGIEHFRGIVKEELKVIRQDLVILDRRDEERFQKLSQEQRTILSQVDQEFAALMQMLTDEAKDGPRLFSFKPVDPKFFDRPKWISAKFQLTLWCEHARQPLPALNPHDQKKGVYEIVLPREWFTKAIPFLKLLTGTLSLVLPVAGSATKLMLDDTTYKGIEEQLDLGQKAIESTLKGGDMALAGDSKSDSRFLEGDAIRAQGSILRELHALLKEKDPSFGGLVRVQNKRREFLWVHPQFVDEY